MKQTLFSGNRKEYMGHTGDTNWEETIETSPIDHQNDQISTSGVIIVMRKLFLACSPQNQTTCPKM